MILLMLAAILILYALKCAPDKSTEAYSLANRQVGVFALTATLVMTEFNTATLISFSSLGYISGMKALFLPLVFLIGLIFYALVVAKKWKDFNGMSVIDFFISRYDRRVGFIAAIFLFVAMSGFSATYLKSLTLLFENLLPGTNYWIISGYLVLISLFLVIRKGLVSIIRVDVFSFVVVLIALLWLLYKTFNGIGALELHESHQIFNSNALSNEFLFSLIPLTMFSYILAPWYGQRIFAARNSRVAFYSVLLSAFFVFIFYAMGVLVSYFVNLNGITLSDAQLSFPFAVDLALNNSVYPLGYVLLFLISSTTLTGVWNAMTNVIVEFIPITKLNKKHYVMVTVYCSILTYLLSNSLIDNILNKMILANIPVIALSFTLLAGFYWPKVSRVGVYASIIVGLVSGVGSYIYFGEAGCYTYYWAFGGISLTFISGFLMSVTFPDYVRDRELAKLEI